MVELSRVTLIGSVQAVLDLDKSGTPTGFYTQLKTKVNCSFRFGADIDEVVDMVCAVPTNLFAHEKAMTVHRVFMVNLISLVGLRCSPITKQKLLDYVLALPEMAKPAMASSPLWP